MSRQRKGSIIKKNGKLYARVRFIDADGISRDIWRTVSSKIEAKKKIKQLIEVGESKTSKELDALTTTFNNLADFYEENYLHEAVYVNERKVSGIRNIIPYKYLLINLRVHFGRQFIQSISYSHIARFRLKRLKTPTKYGKQRSITDVNRQLQLLRRLLNIAVTQGWLKQNPFKNGDSLISSADEIQRSRILSFSEERQLLDIIDNKPTRFHLKGIVLMALDCALRKNEILTICRQDLDFANKVINIRAFNAKTAKPRKVGMTSRVYKWLLQYENLKSDTRIFPNKRFDVTWRKCLKEAGIEDFRFHDCRHSSISRMIQSGLPHTQVMRVSGHSTLSCLFKYINTDSETISNVANALDDFLENQSNKQINPENQSNLIN